MTRFDAVIADSASAIRIGGGKGELTKITLECYLNGEQLEEITSQYRGETLDVAMAIKKSGGLDVGG